MEPTSRENPSFLRKSIVSGLIGVYGYEPDHGRKPVHDWWTPPPTVKPPTNMCFYPSFILFWSRTPFFSLKIITRKHQISLHLSLYLPWNSFWSIKTSVFHKSELCYSWVHVREPFKSSYSPRTGHEPFKASKVVNPSWAVNCSQSRTVHGRKPSQVVNLAENPLFPIQSSPGNIPKQKASVFQHYS